jgi:ATP-dependent DNA helicase RecQ
MEVIRKERSVEIARPVETAPSRGKSARPGMSDHEMEAQPEEPGTPRLFHHLRNLRKQIADDQGVPPYVVFADTTLREMARQRPQTREQFLSISGVGERKLEAYYTLFTGEIRAYCEQNGLRVGLNTSPAPKAPGASGVKKPKAETREMPQRNTSSASLPSGITRQLTRAMFEQGLTIAEIAQRRSLTTGTVLVHLVELLESGETIDVNRLIAPERYNVIVGAIEQVGGVLLRPVKDALGDDYSYEEIRLVRAIIGRDE